MATHHVSHSPVELSRRAVLTCLLLVPMSLCLGLGCNKDESAVVAQADDSHIKPLSSLYAEYMNRNSDRPPASEEEFKRFIAEKGDPLLEAAGVKTVDELFVSPRDNEHYVILYGKDAARLISRGVVAHERTGSDGRRFVGYRMGPVNELDEVEFRKLVPTK